jgi:hypothetical protein
VDHVKIGAHLSQQFIPTGGLRCKYESAFHFLKTKGNPKACQEGYCVAIFGKRSSIVLIQEIMDAGKGLEVATRFRLN